MSSGFDQQNDCVTNCFVKSVLLTDLIKQIDKNIFNSFLESSSLEVNERENQSLLINDSQWSANSSQFKIDPRYIEFRDLSRFWIQRVLVPIVMIIGVIGNSMTIVIMTRRRMRSSTNIYLAALATFDMIYLIFAFVLSLKHYPDISNVRYYYYWKMFPYSLMIADACTSISVWLTVTFTIERFIVISHPIRGKVICTEARAKKVILIVFIICFTYVLPTPFEWVIVETINSETNQTRMEPMASEFGQNQVYKTVYYWTTAVLFIFIPLLLLAVLNSFLIRSVHISRKQRYEMTQSKIFYGKGSEENCCTFGNRDLNSSNKLDHSLSTQETKITVMLISVVLLFLFCQSPVAGILIYSTIRDLERNTNEYYLLTGLNNIFNFLVAINAAGNFVLYSLLSQKYRRTLIKLFCPCFKNRLSRLQSYTQQTLYSAKSSNLTHKAKFLDSKTINLLNPSKHIKKHNSSTSSTPRLIQNDDNNDAVEDEEKEEEEEGEVEEEKEKEEAKRNCEPKRKWEKRK